MALRLTAIAAGLVDHKVEDIHDGDEERVGEWIPLPQGSSVHDFLARLTIQHNLVVA